MLGIILDPPHDSREVLAFFSLEALDQVGAIAFIQRRVIAVVPLPNPAPRRIHQFLEAGDGVPGSELREAVLTIS